MAEDFSLSASLNIQRVDVSKVRAEIKQLSKEGISIPITLDKAQINLPKNFEVNLVIKNAPAIKKQMEKIFSVSSVIEGLGAVVKAEVAAIKKVAADALRDNQSKLDPKAIEKQALKNARNPKRLKAGADGSFDQVDHSSVRQTGKNRNKLLEDANKQEIENARKTASEILELRRKNAADILELQDLVNNARGTKVGPGGGRGSKTGPFVFFQQILNQLLEVNEPTKKQLEIREELTKKLEELQKKEGKVLSNKQRKIVKSQIRDTKAAIRINENEIEARSIETLEKIVTRFAGTTGKSADNLRGSLNTIFNALNSLRQLEGSYKLEEIVDPKAITAIKNAKKQLVELFQNIDASNLTTLRSQIETEIVGPLRTEFKKAERLIGTFNKEIDKLTLRRASAEVTGGPDSELVKNLQQQIDILQDAKKKGGSFSDFINADINVNDGIGSLRERAKQLEILEQRANAADIALEKISKVRVYRSLNLTEAAGYLDTMGKIEEVAIGTATAIDKIRFGGAGRKDEIAQVAVLSSQAEEQVRSLTDRTALLNNTLNTIDTSILKFDNQGLKSTVQAAGSLREEFIRLAQDGTIPLETLANTFNTELAKLDILKSAEDKFNKFNIQLDKVQQGFDAGAKSADKFGAKARLDQGRGELQVAFNANATEKEMELIVSSTTKAISAIEKLNSTYAGLAANFDKSAAKQSDSIGQKTFEDAGKAFAQYVDKIDTKGKTIDQIIKEITEAYTKFNAEAQRDIKLPPTIDKILETLSSKKSGFESKGQAKAAEGIDRLVVSVSALDAAGADIEQIQKVFNRGLVDVDRINQDEKALEKYRISLEKLRVSLKAPDAATDFFKAGETLEKGAKTFDNVKNAGAQKEVLTSRLAAITAEVKARQRLNSTVDSLINKFGDLEAAQTRTAAGLTFRKAGADFQKTVQKIVAGGGDIRQQLRTIQFEFIRTRIQASIEAEGGFLGSISKLAGLATKRLLAFVGIARLTFSIQSAFTEAVTAGLELEVQTNKLEQVFAKTFTTEESLVNATNDVTDAIFKMSQEYGVAVGEVTKASRILAQAGFSGEALTKSLEAISKANLTATFNDINQTAEASIAVLNQFKLEADQLEAVLGGINRVSSLYAVESEGIAKAVRKAGGAFQNAGGNISEFVGAFTILKKETREADEALATALRNISIRLQRTTIQDKVGGLLGIDFLDTQGQFIGVTKSLGQISAKLKELNIASTDPRFAAVVENIAGARQFARLIPLLNQYGELAEIQDEFNKGAGSLDEDAARAMTTLNNKMEQLRSTFAELSNAVLTSDLFKNLVDGLNLVVKGLNKAVKLFGNINVLLLAASAIALPKIISSGFAFKFLEGTGADPFGLAGKLFNRNSGGIIPGRGPNADTVPAMLTRGEYVIQRDAVDKYGVGFFDRVNAKKYNSGGRVGYNTGSPGGVGSEDENLSKVLKALGLSLTDAGKDLVKSIQFISEEAIKQRVTAKNPNISLPDRIEGAASKQAGVFINEDLSDEQKRVVVTHEVTHQLDQNLTPEQKQKRDDLASRAKDSEFGKYTSNRAAYTGNNLDRETFADLGAFAVESQQESSPLDKTLEKALSGPNAKENKKLLDEMLDFLKDLGLTLDGISSQSTPAATTQNPIDDLDKRIAASRTKVDSIKKEEAETYQKASKFQFSIPSEASGKRSDEQQKRLDDYLIYLRELKKRHDEEIALIDSLEKERARLTSSSVAPPSLPDPPTDQTSSQNSIDTAQARRTSNKAAAKARRAPAPTSSLNLSDSEFDEAVTRARANARAKAVARDKAAFDTANRAADAAQNSPLPRQPRFSSPPAARAVSGGGNQISKLISSLGPVTPMLLKFAGGLSLGTTALSMFAHITEESSLSVNDWVVALGTGAATFGATIALFNTFNGILATANARLALANVKGLVEDFKGGFRGRGFSGRGNSDFIGPVRQSRSAALGGLTGKASNLIGKISPKLAAAGKGYAELLSFAGKGLARFGAGLAASGGVLAPLVGGLSAATVIFKALGSAARANAQELLNEAKTREEAAEALDKFDFADRLSSGFGVFTAVGNIAKGIGSELSSFGKGLYEAIPGLQSFASSVSGWAAYIADLLPEDQKVLLEQSSRRAFSDAKFDLQESNKATGGLASDDKNTVNKAEKEVKEKLDSAARNIFSAIVRGANAQDVEISKFIANDEAGKSSAKELKKNVENAIKNGVTFNAKELTAIKRTLNVAGLEIDTDALQKAQAALDRTSLLFLRMEVVANQALNNMTAVQGNLSKFDQVLNSLTGDSFDFQIPDQVFDLIDKGVDPAALGLEGFSERIKEKLNSINPAEAALFNLEFGAKELSRKLNESIAATGDEIKFNPNVGGDPENPGTTVGTAVAVQLQERAAGLSGGAILEAYNDFIITKTSEFEREAEAAQEAGALFKLTAQQINDINKEFADTYQKGGIENLKKRFQIEAEFTNRYASILSKRFALEDQYADRLNRGLDIEKTRTEFSNKLKDPTDGGDLTGKQAEVLDQRRLANLLKDTGLSGSSSIKDIEDKLFSI
jgi:TP901 family phage tail tape measure protein